VIEFDVTACYALGLIAPSASPGATEPDAAAMIGQHGKSKEQVCIFKM
jgi:hypothetical protein